MDMRCLLGAIFLTISALQDENSDRANYFQWPSEGVNQPPPLPWTTLLAAEKAEAIAKRGLSFAELSRTEAGHMERLLAGEIQWAMQKMFRQYAAIADLLLPTESIPKEKSTAVKEEAKAKAQPQLNFGE